MFSPNAAQSRVLDIPELLDMIFGFLDESSNASNASVCKRWSDIALDTLWRDLDDLYRLFRILKPLKQAEEYPDSPYAFTNPPDAEDWQRLEKRYSRRVRRLTYQAEGRPRMCPTAFEDVARTRTSLNILPNLNTLVWDAAPSLAVIFMQPTVKNFGLWLPLFTPPESSLPFFRDVVSRMPHLTTLDIRTVVPMSDMEDSMVFLLQSLPKLRKVVTPRYLVTTRIAETLQHLEDLGTIEFQYASEQGCGDPVDTQVFRPTLKTGAFPSLFDLSLTCPVADCISLMKQSCAPTNLTAFYVDSPLIESPAAVHDLLTVLVETCQLLETLGIITLVSNDEPLQALSDISSTERISYSSLRPIQTFPNLTIFEVAHQFPLDLKLEDLEQLARSWPSLRKLVLNHEPVVAEQSSLTLKALIPFAQHCPELQELGLFINASTADLPSSYQTNPPQFKPFAKLRRLSLGVSLVADEGAVALFLSQICPLNVHLEYGVTWDMQGREETELFQTIARRCAKWAKVAELLPLLTKMRMEERERTRLLMAEVKDLRMRSGVLMDRAAVTGGLAVGPSTRDSCVML
ncbi:hypothetical protein DFH08DRAFT_91485 [Mycena albidolilacea]|uniref:F-box domain-containing protein n=1 Tax=Mycena albidolilacea TaxID=1033008 RepID=A0AAD7EVT9_9AGAR|nr:hypothetical protein DFH08DRAFT_91485 [Mycena albidolilacea]